jgi:hypothetical protein
VLNLPWASSGVALASLIIGRTRSNQSLAVFDSLPNYSRNSFRDLKKYFTFVCRIYARTLSNALHAWLKEGLLSTVDMDRNRQLA